MVMVMVVVMTMVMAIFMGIVVTGITVTFTWSFIIAVCLTQQATLWEGLGLFGGYLVYVLAVTQGHRVPPMLKADRVVWYALKAQVRNCCRHERASALRFALWFLQNGLPDRIAGSGHRPLQRRQ